MNWDQKFLQLAFNIAEWSKDRSTKVGCVIVGPNHEILTTGYNGMCRGVNDYLECRHERPAKYMWFEHAERNAIFNAARVGIPLDGSILYCASAMSGPPCVDCCRALIQSGVTRVVGSIGDDDPNKWNERWKDSMKVSVEMFKECGIVFHTVSLQ
jgi:dCMP deaminase